MTDDVRAALLLAQAQLRRWLLSSGPYPMAKDYPDVRAALDAVAAVLDGEKPTVTIAAWLCGRGHTERQPTCPACHDIAHARA